MYDQACSPNTTKLQTNTTEKLWGKKPKHRANYKNKINGSISDNGTICFSDLGFLRLGITFKFL